MKTTEKINQIAEEAIQKIREAVNETEVTEQQELKVPFWGAFVTLGGSVHVEYIVRIEGDRYYCGENCQYGVNGSFWRENSFLRLATSKEIESHLTKLAKQKGFVRGCSFISAMTKTQNTVHDEVFLYKHSIDALFLDGNVVYLDGKWAELVENKFPTWKELGVGEICIGFWDYDDEDRWIGKFHIKAEHDADTFIKLLAVAKYLNKRDKTDYNPVRWRYFTDVPMQFVEIFKQNNSQQELLDFYK